MTNAVGPARDPMGIFKHNEVPDTFRISFLANSLVLPVYEEIRREHDLSRGEYLLLFCLSSEPELTAQDVADMTGRPRNSISRAVHRMLRDGYLTRSPDPDDGRQALLRISPTGLELHKTIVAKFVGREAELLGVLSNTERRTLDHLLNKLVSNAIR